MINTRKYLTSSEDTSTDIEIVDYKPEHQPYFKQLNEAWISKYFHMEEWDYKILNDPEKYLIESGGCILMALYRGEIAGTVGLKKEGEGVYEMTKMAVDEHLQGKHIGWLLGKTLIEKAKTLHAKKIELYSHTSLLPALHLYRKLGFREVQLTGQQYDRCDIKMELQISQDTKSILEVKLAGTVEDVEKCFLALLALRPHLQKDTYLQRIQSQQTQGYQLAFIGNEEHAFSAMGFRFMEMLYCGKIIYIDDLSTLPDHRGKGYAGQLLDWLIVLAKEKQVEQIHLDSGHHRHGAHRLYLNKGFDITSHHFRLDVNQ